jgi:hypothetical protein
MTLRIPNVGVEARPKAIASNNGLEGAYACAACSASNAAKPASSEQAA